MYFHWWGLVPEIVTVVKENRLILVLGGAAAPPYRRLQQAKQDVEIYGHLDCELVIENLLLVIGLFGFF
jgi:hypothetical protein